MTTFNPNQMTVSAEQRKDHERAAQQWRLARTATAPRASEHTSFVRQRDQQRTPPTQSAWARLVALFL